MGEKKKLLYKSKVEYASYGINHYQGCEHGCLYCWAMRRSIRFGDCKNRSDWLHPRLVKDAADRVFAELHSGPFAALDKRQLWVWLCPATDPYQPIEEEEHATSSILKHLINARIPTRILTKSEGVYWDEDTIIRHNDLIQVGFSITTIDDDVGRKWEPNASLIHDRMKAIRYFHANGVRTWVSVEPPLDRNPLRIVEELFDSVDQWVFGKANYIKLNLPWAIMRQEIIHWFQERYASNYLIKKELMEVPLI